MTAKPLLSREFFVEKSGYSQVSLMHLKVLSKRARTVHELLSFLYVDGFVLAGGTALALQFGHRLSVDFDFFSEKDFNVPAMLRRFSGIAKIEVRIQDEHSLTVSANKVKLSLFRYWDRFLFPPLKAKGFVLTDPRDIALMKILAIANCGSRKDFIDLFFLLRKSLTLEDLFELLKSKFPKVDYNPHHILKSLAYFDDAEKEPLPKMLVPFSWPELKADFQRRFAAELG